MDRMFPKAHVTPKQVSWDPHHTQGTSVSHTPISTRTILYSIKKFSRDACVIYEGTGPYTSGERVLVHYTCIRRGGPRTLHMYHVQQARGSQPIRRGTCGCGMVGCGGGTSSCHTWYRVACFNLSLAEHVVIIVGGQDACTQKDTEWDREGLHKQHPKQHAG